MSSNTTGRHGFVPDLAISVVTTFLFDKRSGRLWRNGENGPIYSVGALHYDHPKCGQNCVYPQDDDVVSLTMEPDFDIELTQNEMTSDDPRVARSIIEKIAESHYCATAYHLGRIKAPEPHSHIPFRDIHTTNEGEWQRTCKSVSAEHVTALVSRDTYESGFPPERLYDDCFAHMKPRQTGISRYRKRAQEWIRVDMYWTRAPKVSQDSKIDPTQIPSYWTRKLAVPLIEVTDTSAMLSGDASELEKLDSCTNWVMNLSEGSNEGDNYLEVPPQYFVSG